MIMTAVITSAVSILHKHPIFNNEGLHLLGVEEYV